jgi:hypothetical protein
MTRAVTRRNLFRLRLIKNSGELTPAGAAVLESKLMRRKKFGVARKTLPASRNGALIAPLRPYQLALASDTLGSWNKRDGFDEDRLRRWQDRIEKQCGWQKPKVDRSGEHWELFLSWRAWWLPSVHRMARNCRP